jgi:N-acetylglutamate synthase-like GNAT family acetyltransferase
VPVNFNIARSGYSIREATSDDAVACRMLLGELPADSQHWVAVEWANQLVVGAAALVLAPRTKPLLGYGCLVHVVPPCRGSGIGGDLLDQVAGRAMQLGGRALYAVRRVELDSEEMHGLQRLGFTVCETIEEHLLPLTEFEPRLAPLLDWFRKHDAIPGEARIAPLYRTDLDAVTQLHLDHLGGDRESLLRRMRGEGDDAFHGRYSRVLLVGERVAGCILARGHSMNTAIVDAAIVAPELRGGWANIWLKLEAARAAQSLGVTHFQFTTFDRYGDTRRFTAKFGGATTRRWALMYRPLDRHSERSEESGPMSDPSLRSG